MKHERGSSLLLQDPGAHHSQTIIISSLLGQQSLESLCPMGLLTTECLAIGVYSSCYSLVCTTNEFRIPLRCVMDSLRPNSCKWVNTTNPDMPLPAGANGL